MDAPPVASVPAPRVSAAALSEVQLSTWYEHAAWPVHAPLAQAFDIVGPLDRLALGRAVAELVRRHEVLRTTTPVVGGTPRLVLADPPDAVLEYSDAVHLTRPGERHDYARRSAAIAGRAFDRATGPLYRFRLTRVAEARHVLDIVLDPLVADRDTIDVLARDLATLYAAPAADREVPPPPLPSFYDVTRAQRRDDDRHDRVRAAAAALRGAPLTVAFPFGHGGRRVSPGGAATRSVAIRAPHLAGSANGAGTTARTAFFLAMYATLVQRYTSQADLVVVVPGSDQRPPGCAGPFTREVAVRVRCAPDTTVAELVRGCERLLVEVGETGVAVADVAGELATALPRGLYPWFPLRLEVTREPQPPDLVGLRCTALPPLRQRAHFTLRCEDRPGTTRLTIAYDEACFDAAFVRRAAADLERMVATASAHPGTLLGDLTGDRCRPVHGPRRRAVPEGADGVAAVARTDPARVAVELPTRATTYGDLDTAAAAVAREGRPALPVDDERRAPVLVAALRARSAPGTVGGAGPLWPGDPASAAAWRQRLWAVTPADRVATLTPAMSAATACAELATLDAGATVVVPPDAEEGLDAWFLAARPTVAVVPSVVVPALGRTIQLPSSLRLVVVASGWPRGATLPAPRGVQVLGEVFAADGRCVAFSRAAEGGLAPTVLPVDGCTLSVVDEQGRTTPPFAVGRLRADDADGDGLTGHLARFDAHGRITVLRDAATIEVVRGFHVDAAVELLTVLLLSHPAVADAAVVVRNDAIVANVVTTGATETLLDRWLADHGAPVWPTCYRGVSAIPRTSDGSVDDVALPAGTPLPTGGSPLVAGGSDTVSAAFATATGRVPEDSAVSVYRPVRIGHRECVRFAGLARESGLDVDLAELWSGRTLREIVAPARQDSARYRST